jgi:hypothetical protein
VPSSAFPLSTDFDPTFGAAAEKLRAAAAARGIKTHYISGVRSKDDQAQLYANYLAGQRGQPLPYPERGRVPLAAIPGTSLHERGLAADIEADNPADEAALRAMAPQFGLRTKGPGDPNHFEIAAIPKGGGAPGTFAYGDGGEPPTTVTAYAEPATKLTSPALSAIDKSAPAAGQPSANMSHEQFIRDYAAKIGLNPDLAIGIARAEGLRAWSPSNPNAASYVDRSGGQPFSFGDFQLNVHPGAMGSKALAAGIDPRDPKQWQAADQFALDQMKAGGIKPWSDPFARQWTASGKPITGGTTLTTVPEGVVDPSIVARGGTSPAIPEANTGYTPATTVASAPSFGDAAAKGDVGGMIKAALTKPTTKDAQGNEVEGKSPLEKLSGAFAKPASSAAPEIPAMPVMQPVQDTMAQMAGPSQQLFSTVSAAAAKPLSWSSTPYGSGAGQLGTTLNATGYGYG